MHHQSQPLSLYPLSIAYMGERFGYFMIRSILVLYMVKILLFSAEHAFSIFAAFSALLYLSPLIGGPLIDRYINNKLAVLIGGGLLALGFILLGISEEHYIDIALGMIISGKGFYAPSTIAVFGKIYSENDPRREGGFSILYTAINVSAIIPPLISGSCILYFGWSSTFLLAGIVTIIGTLLFCFFSRDKITTHKIKVSHYFLLALGIALSIYVYALFIHNTHLTYILLSILSSILILYGLKKSFTYPDKVRNRLLMCFILTAYSIIFFALSQQSAMSLALFTEYNVDRNIWIFDIPTFFFFALNPFFIITLGPLFSIIWFRLSMKNLNPSIPMKFALGTILLGLGFIILLFAISYTSYLDNKINFGWIVISYFFQSLGELLIYPIGLAMITQFSPKSMTGFMIGLWYFAAAIGNACAGFISQWTTISPTMNDPLQISAAYSQVFGLLGCFAIGTGILLIGCIYYSKKLKFAENHL